MATNEHDADTPNTIAKRTCTSTRSNGEPCRANPLKGSDPPLCFSHADASSTKQFFGKGHEGRGGRPKIPTLGDLIREEILNDPGLALAAIRAARDDAVVVGVSKDGDVYASEHPDHALRSKAAMDFISLGFAKPKENAELSVDVGADGGVVVRLAFDPKPEEAE